MKDGVRGKIISESLELKSKINSLVIEGSEKQNSQ